MRCHLIPQSQSYAWTKSHTSCLEIPEDHYPCARETHRKWILNMSRNGTCSIFAFVEPLCGICHVSVREHRTAIDWAEEIKYPMDVSYPDCDKIMLQFIPQFILSGKDQTHQLPGLRVLCQKRRSSARAFFLLSIQYLLDHTVGIVPEWVDEIREFCMLLVAVFAFKSAYPDGYFFPLCWMTLRIRESRLIGCPPHCGQECFSLLLLKNTNVLIKLNSYCDTIIMF